jgi:signal peptidase I
LEGSKFNITTLERLIQAADFQEAVGFSLQNGKIVSDQDKGRIEGILTEVVTIIADGKQDGQKFTERNVDTEEHRTIFLEKLLPKHPKKKKAASAWVISGKPVNIKLKDKKKSKSTPTTDEQINLIPRKFKLELPAGKINDIFNELKELDVTKRRYAVSVLFRVFLDLTLDDYIAKHSIVLPKDNNGKTDDKMLTRLGCVIDHSKKSNLLTKKELKPINVARNNKDSFAAPETLNAYVHSRWMNPNPLELKISWANFQLFIERLWTSKK